MIDDIEAVFEKYDDEYLEFDKVENPVSRRPDIHAFVLLDRLIPGTTDIVSAAGHDEIYLEVDVEELAKVASEEDIRTLVRCGVRYESGGPWFCMFV